MESNEVEKFRAELATWENKKQILDGQLEWVDQELKEADKELFEAKVKRIAAGEICDVSFERLMRNTGIVKSFYDKPSDEG
ncbi:hypothetical protein [Lacticaseibacillus sharpeae]|nr:hypothetical protein [Lacticaseibacillus sharpeae]